MFMIFVFMKQLHKFLLTILIPGIIFISTISVSSQNKRYTVFKAGFGLPYGAYGLNLEYRYKKLGGYIGAGYMKSQYFSNIHIPSSFNGALGLKYYFFRTEELLHPILGIHAGWLNNYYHKDIGQLKYRSSVYGAALIAGFEMIENVTSIEMSMVIDPGIAVLNPETHPNYKGKIYFTPSIGIGINIYALKMYFKKKERMKNRENIDMEEKIEDRNHISTTHINTEKKDYSTVVTEKIINECNDTLAFPAIKIYKEDSLGNHWIGKQIAENMFLYIKIKGKVEGYDKSLQTFMVDSNLKSHEILVIKTNNPDDLKQITQQILNNDIKNAELFNCYQGKLAIYTYGNPQNEISIQLTDLKLKSKIKSELYFDEILICLVSKK